MKLHDNYDVGLYCRLSRDDNNGNLESMSIANQRQMLENYVREKGWTLRECYVDDGWSGTNFDRPDFKRMIRDIELGKIDCIITKDLSRLGRNYVQTGYYTEEYFVDHGIRFIAINDSIDTMQENNDIAAFHHVLNEFYPKQVSKKVRQVKKTSAQAGKFMGSQAPFGYMKSPEDKHMLIIDEEAAPIVRRLFSEYAGGDSARLIAERLNTEGVDSPRFYHYAKQGRVNPLSEQKNTWGSATVIQLLRNRVYIGHMVQGKRQVVSFKTKKVRQVDPEDWIVVENTHEPLINNSLWERVQVRMSTGHCVRKTKRETVGLFAGLLRCADCDSPLAYMRKELKSGEKGVYRCSRYNNNGGKVCSTHYIDEDIISEFVLRDIREHAQLAVLEREKLAERLLSSMKRSQGGEAKIIRTKIREAEHRITTIAATLKNLYEDKCAGKLPDTIFFGMANDYSREQAELEAALLKLRREMDIIQETAGGVDSWIALVESYMNLESLNRDIVTGLIEGITVHERERKYGRQEQTLEIRYRFVGSIPKNTKEDIV